ncbi:MAG: 1,6-anhydro-N-acetylmuramyl-L-alanine amidase AmpD [Burkholderiales bacterium]|nr:1,6-anhydro-N-acetylmuramyl-L-alanine amidase AmpD [Burkholderiales bacterium]MDE2434170.1 1,6-anhydro-N-acetylmuramyl-L-alanine amidase AmpD [Burkholderiales bacterium]
MLTDPTWQDGWLNLARPVPSPNFGPRPTRMPIEMVVIHSISLPPGRYGGNEVELLFTNQLDWSAHPYFETIRGAEVSAHFYIRRDGELVQFVSANDRAWHAGQSTWQGRDNCNDYSIGIELEGLEDFAFEPQQYATLASLIQAIQQAYPITTVVGHEHIAPGRKKDPGSAFDWGHLKTVLAADAHLIPALPPRA